MVGIQTRDPVATMSLTPSAVVWINGRQALVATMSADGDVTTAAIDRELLPEASYLAQVVRTIGDRQRVLILGPGSVRLALEREYVALVQRPDRLVDVEPEGAIGVPDLIDRLRTLAA